MAVAGAALSRGAGRVSRRLDRLSERRFALLVSIPGLILVALDRPPADPRGLRDEPLPDRAGQGRPGPVHRASQLPGPAAGRPGGHRRDPADPDLRGVVDGHHAAAGPRSPPSSSTAGSGACRSSSWPCCCPGRSRRSWPASSGGSIFDTNHGIVNGVLVGVGILDEPFNWLASTAQTVVIALVAQSWRSVPLLAVLLLAALKTIPPALYRAAKMDGATSWESFRFITLPGDQEHPDRGRRPAGHHRPPGLRPAVQPDQRRTGAGHLRPDHGDLRHHVRTDQPRLWRGDHRAPVPDHRRGELPDPDRAGPPARPESPIDRRRGRGCRRHRSHLAPARTGRREGAAARRAEAPEDGRRSRFRLPRPSPGSASRSACSPSSSSTSPHRLDDRSPACSRPRPSPRSPRT